MTQVCLYQIAHSEATYAAIEPGYLILDNRANERPDWFEYWPIRRFLLTETLDDSAFYGFFSPKFGNKTRLSHDDVVRFVARGADRGDVFLFSPQPDMAAFFLNVFEQADLFDPGALDTYAALLERIGLPAGLRGLIMDSRHAVFSNYFVARPPFWRAWLAINEAMFAICEGPDCALKTALCQETTYPGAVHRKVFLQERTASYLLTTRPEWRSVPHDPYAMAWSASRLREFPVDAVISDALKMAYRDRGFPEYLGAFDSIRRRLHTP